MPAAPSLLRAAQQDFSLPGDQRGFGPGSLCPAGAKHSQNKLCFSEAEAVLPLPLLSYSFTGISCGFSSEPGPVPNGLGYGET